MFLDFFFFLYETEMNLPEKIPEYILVHHLLWLTLPKNNEALIIKEKYFFKLKNASTVITLNGAQYGKGVKVTLLKALLKQKKSKEKKIIFKLQLFFFFVLSNLY